MKEILTKEIASKLMNMKGEARGIAIKQDGEYILKEKGRAQVWEIKQIFPEVSKRTLRRDFEQMVNQGIIERMGERNDTFYQVKTG